MKIAHINIIFSKGNMVGVERKLIEEAKAMVKNNIDVYILNREKNGFENNINYINIDEFFNKKGKLFELYIRMFKYNLIEKVINLSKYDFFIIRYTFVDFSAFKFAKKYKNRIITEHHTKELDEIKVQNIKEPFKTFQYLLEKYFAKYFFKNVYGIIGISSDVVESVQKRVGINLNRYVLSNGITINSFNTLKERKIEKTINIIFVASIFQKWHGLDRLIKSLQIYNGGYDIILHIIGNVKDEDMNLIKTFTNKKCKINYYGKLSKTELEKIYYNTHIAIDSLAMFRIGMSESSTLKSKEYIKYGLPFLYSAPDPDMKKIQKYLFNCKNNEDLIDFESIVEKYVKNNQQEMIRDFKNVLQNTLSWDVKIEKLCEWINENK